VLESNDDLAAGHSPLPRYSGGEGSGAWFVPQMMNRFLEIIGVSWGRMFL
jgi:hypothetical protein